MEIKSREAIALSIHIFIYNVLECNNNNSVVTQTDESTGCEPGTDKTELTMDPSDSEEGKVVSVNKLLWLAAYHASVLHQSSNKYTPSCTSPMINVRHHKQES